MTFKHPESMSVYGWRARKASLASHHVPTDDPRYAECDDALALRNSLPIPEGAIPPGDETTRRTWG